MADIPPKVLTALQILIPPGFSLLETVLYLEQLGGPGGGGGTYTNSEPSTITVGGIATGSTFDGQSLTDLFNQMLYPYQDPAFTYFALAGPNPIEVGTILSGSQTFVWATSNSGNVQADSIDLFDITGGGTLASGLANGGTDTFSLPTPVQLTIAGSYEWGISGSNTQSSTFAGTYQRSWEWLVDYGESANVTLTAGQIQALRVSGLQPGFAGNYAFDGGGYDYLCWPTALGYPSSFRDAATGFVVALATPSDNAAYSHLNNGYYSSVVSVTNAHGVTTDYAVYRSQSIINSAITIQVG